MRSLIARELRLASRQGSDTVAALVFFIICGTMFAFGAGPDPKLLAGLAPGVVWVAALLAALLPLEKLFGADFEDGTLDLLLLSGLPAYLVALAKSCAHWLTTGLPLLLIAAPLAIMLRMPSHVVPLLLIGLVPGTLIFSLVGTLTAALTLGARRGGVLMALITLPLMMPALIFGANAVMAPHPLAAFAFLGAILCLALPLAPLAAGAALRLAVE